MSNHGSMCSKKYDLVRQIQFVLKERRLLFLSKHLYTNVFLS